MGTFKGNITTLAEYQQAMKDIVHAFQIGAYEKPEYAIFDAANAALNYAQNSITEVLNPETDNMYQAVAFN